MHLRLALALELSLLLFPQLLVELSASAGLVAVGLCGQGSVNLAQTVLLAQLLIVLLLALRFALELVGNGSLILCNVVSVSYLIIDGGVMWGIASTKVHVEYALGNLLES